MLPRALCVFFFATFLSGAAFDTFFFAALGEAAAEDFLGMFWTRRALFRGEHSDEFVHSKLRKV